MLVAIPSVTTYINNSRKNAYIDSAKKLIDGAVVLVNSGSLDVYDTDTTYYIPASCIATETGSESSPYAKWTDRYVVVTYNNDSYDYYWASTDESKMGIRLTYREHLNIDRIKPNIEKIDANIGIGNRSAIVKFTDCVTGDAPEPAQTFIAERDSVDTVLPVNTPETPSTPSTTTTDNLTWQSGDLRITFDFSNSWNDGKIIQPSITVRNMSTSETITGFTATFTIPPGAHILQGSWNSNDMLVTISGNTLTVVGNPNKLVDRFIAPSNPKNTGLQIEYSTPTTIGLANGNIEYTTLKPGNVTYELSDLKVEMVRKNLDDNNGKYTVKYGVSVTNISNHNVTGWSFRVNGAGISNVRVHLGLVATATTSSYIDVAVASDQAAIYTLRPGAKAEFDKPIEFDINDVNTPITIS
jgi:hypothetical protein